MKNKFMKSTLLTTLLLLAACGAHPEEQPSPVTSQDSVVTTSEDSSSEMTTTSVEETTSEESITSEEVTTSEESSEEITTSEESTTSEETTTSEEQTTSEEEILVNKIVLSPKNPTIEVEESVKITASIEPENAQNKEILWESDDTSVATVDQEGNVLGIKPGVAIISATNDRSGANAATTVRVVAKPTVGEYQIEVDNSEHIIGELFAEDLKTPLNGIDHQGTFYIKTTSTADNYQVKEILVKAFNDMGSVSLTNVASYDEQSGMYRATCPYSAGKKIVVEIIEVNATLLDGANLPGDYFVLQRAAYSAPHAFTSFNDRAFNIDLSGLITYGTSYSNQLSSYTAKSDEGSAKDDSHYVTFLYSDTTFAFNEGTSNYLNAPFYNSNKHDSLAFKKINQEDEISDYQIASEVINVNENDYWITSIFYKENKYTSALLDYSSKKVYFDVDVEMINGENISSSDAVYKVKKEGETLLAVSYQNDGGVDDRIALEAPCGLYDNGEKSLLIPNVNSAIYDGKNYVASIEENTVTLTNGERKIVITIDQSNMTYVVVSDEEIHSGIPNFKGLTFVGTCYDEWNEYDVQVKVIFDNYEGDNISGILHYDATAYVHHDFGFTATFDTSSNIMTFTITTQNYNEGVIGKTFTALISSKTMKFTSSFSNIYSTKGGILTCNDFAL